jgi:CheY-like chemotaxis protein
MARVLLVDDEERILAALCRSLRREGYEIVTAQTPREALSLLEEQGFDAVLTDYKMPGMTGVELLAQVARLQPSAGKLLITGWSEAVTDAEIEVLEIDAVIPKPWEDAELRGGLRKAIG